MRATAGFAFRSKVKESKASLDKVWTKDEENDQFSYQQIDYNELSIVE